MRGGVLYWLSSKAMTVLVQTDFDGIITVAPPVVYKFLGQHINNLTGWMQKQPDFIWCCILGEK